MNCQSPALQLLWDKNSWVYPEFCPEFTHSVHLAPVIPSLSFSLLGPTHSPRDVTPQLVRVLSSSRESWDLSGWDPHVDPKFQVSTANVSPSEALIVFLPWTTKGESENSPCASSGQRKGPDLFQDKMNQGIIGVDCIGPTPLSLTGTTRTGCSKLCPTCLWTFPWMVQPQLFWEISTSASPTTEGRIHSQNPI